MSLTVTHAETLFVGQPVSYSVQVESDGSPVDGATVCLWKDGDIYEVGTTSGGVTSFGVEPASEGTLHVTVTGRNYIPHEGAATVEIATSVSATAEDVPMRLELVSLLPNPFNPTVEITFTVPADRAPEPIELNVYSPTGRLVKTLLRDALPPGPYKARWNGRDEGGSDVASGVYLCELRRGEERRTARMVLIR